MTKYSTKYWKEKIKTEKDNTKRLTQEDYFVIMHEIDELKVSLVKFMQNTTEELDTIKAKISFTGR